MKYLDSYYLFLLYNLDKFWIYDDWILDFEYIHPTIRKSISFPLFLENLISHNLTEEIIFEVHEVKDWEKTMKEFLVKRGESVSMKVLNKYAWCVWLDNYTIWLKPNIKKGKIKEFLEEYFNSWKNHEMDMTYYSFLKPKKQLERFSEILEKKLEDYWKGFQYKLMHLTEIDELSILIYFWQNKGIMIKNDCLNITSVWSQDIFFFVEVDKNKILKEIWKEKVKISSDYLYVLNEDNKVLYTLKSLESRYIKYLIDVWSDLGAWLRWIKAWLSLDTKEESIKKFIEAINRKFVKAWISKELLEIRQQGHNKNLYYLHIKK